MSNPPGGIPNPYVGPRSFQVGERIYGRKREANQLLNLIVAERIVLLHSPSGAGKTSLIQAALIPRLKKMRFHVLPVARVNLDVSDTLAGGFECNRYVFSVLLSLEEDVPEEEKISPEWLSKMSLPDYLEKRFRPEGSMDVEVLIFDQFEEILTLDPTDQIDKEEFFKQVGETLEAPNRWALFAIRDDFVAALDPYLVWIPNRLSVNFRLDLLGLEAARRAIQEPAKLAGVEFEDEAAGKLIDDLRRVRVQQPDGSVSPQLGPHVEPVQLQVVCYRIWEDPRPDQTRITADDLADFDQVDQSLVDRSLTDYYARQVISSAEETGTREREIREWFDRRLITEQGVRGTVLMGSETSGGLDNNAIRLLVDAHLVRAEKRGGATWYELSHDRLLEPIREDNIAWYSENLSLLQRQADLWHEEGRKEGVLLVGETLDEAQLWAQENEDVLTEVEREFLEASLKRRERKEQERVLEQERLDAAEKLAEEQTRSAKRARRWTIAIGIIGLLFVALAVFAFGLYNSSNKTSNFIEAIVACEGEDYDSCETAAKSAVEEEKYLLLVVHACEDGLRAAVEAENETLYDTVETACEQAVEMSDENVSLPLLNDLCENLYYMVGEEDVTRNICNQAVKLARTTQKLSLVYTTCAIGKNVGLNEKDIESVCDRAIELVTISEDLQTLEEICGNYSGLEIFQNEDVQRACDRYNTVALESATPKVLRDLCLEYRGEGLSEEDQLKACNQAVDMVVETVNASEARATVVETGNASVARELCLLGREAGMSVETVQRACSGYQDLSTTLAESSEDAYILTDMCFSGFEAGLTGEVVETACGRAVALAVETGDSYTVKDLCLFGQDYGVPEAAVQGACGGYQDLSITLAETSADPYVLSEMCLSGLEADLTGEVIQAACGRAVELGGEIDDPYFHSDLCWRGQDAKLPAEVVQQSCDQALELAIFYDDPYTLSDMCLYGLDAGVAEEFVQAACGEAIDLVVETGDSYVAWDLCLYGRDTGMTEESVQRACSEYQVLSITLAETSEDPYDLSNMCFSGFEAGLTDDVIQMACERGIQLASDTNDSYLLLDFCDRGLESGLGSDEVNGACNLAAEIAIRDEDVDLSEYMCWYYDSGNISSRNYLRVCEVASNQILPGEQMSSFLNQDEFDIWSFQGIEGQTVTLTLRAGSNGQIFQLWLMDPLGDWIFGLENEAGNQDIIIDQEQLTDSGTYTIGVYNLGEGPSEYKLEFRLEGAGP